MAAITSTTAITIITMATTIIIALTIYFEIDDDDIIIDSNIENSYAGSNHNDILSGCFSTLVHVSP